MTQQDYERIIQATKKVSERMRQDKSYALKILQNAGIVDEQGNLTEPFRPSNQLAHAHKS
jgi:hypothetical protein